MTLYQVVHVYCWERLSKEEPQNKTQSTHYSRVDTLTNIRVLQFVLETREGRTEGIREGQEHLRRRVKDF